MFEYFSLGGKEYNLSGFVLGTHPLIQYKTPVPTLWMVWIITAPLLCKLYFHCMKITIVSSLIWNSIPGPSISSYSNSNFSNLVPTLNVLLGTTFLLFSKQSIKAVSIIPHKQQLNVVKPLSQCKHWTVWETLRAHLKSERNFSGHQRNTVGN